MSYSNSTTSDNIYDAYPPTKAEYSFKSAEEDQQPFNFHFSSIVAETQDNVLQEARSLLAQWSENTSSGITTDQYSHLHINEESQFESREIKRVVAGMIGDVGIQNTRRKKLASDPSVVMEARQIICRESKMRASTQGSIRSKTIQDRAVKK
jgi:hypothetical protein